MLGLAGSPCALTGVMGLPAHDRWVVDRTGKLSGIAMLLSGRRALSDCAGWLGLTGV